MTVKNATPLILLVGSNPLPNYLSACALRPARVALVYTSETEDAKDRLKRALHRVLGSGVEPDELFIEDSTCATKNVASNRARLVEEVFVEDSTCATVITRAITGELNSNMSGDAWLNYTGDQGHGGARPHGFQRTWRGVCTCVLSR